MSLLINAGSLSAKLYDYTALAGEFCCNQAENVQKMRGWVMADTKNIPQTPNTYRNLEECKQQIKKKKKNGTITYKPSV